jgi:hypothetical protein
MTFRKEDLPKIIALSLVLVAALIWAVFATLKSYHHYAGGGSATARAPEAKGPTAPGQPGPTGSAAAPSNMLAGLLTPVPPPNRDPFDPVIAPRWQQEATSRPTPEEAKPEPSPLPVLPPLPGAAAGEKGVLHVTGILLGAPPIVVLRRGDQPYIVKQGDYVEGGLRVESIRRDSVTLRDRQGAYVLRLGE